MDQWILKLIAEADVIRKAPMAFASVVIALGVLGYLVHRWAYRTVLAHRDSTISSLEARLKLRDDQLEGKMSSTPLDEAMAMIRALEERVSRQAFRRLSAKRAEDLSALIQLPDRGSHTVGVMSDISCHDCNQYAWDLCSAFPNGTGWQVSKGGIADHGYVAPSGLGILSRTPATPSPPERIVIDAFRQFGIKFDVLKRDGEGEDDVEILVMPPTD